MNKSAGGASPENSHDVRILEAVRRIIRAVDLHSRKLLGEWNLTTPQLVALLHIVKHGPTTVSAISKGIHLSASTIVGILDRLEARGLVERERGTADRRQVFLTASDKGRQVAADAPSPLQEELANALRTLPAEEQAAIAKSLERIVDIMELGHIDASPILDTGPIGDAE